MSSRASDSYPSASAPSAERLGEWLHATAAELGFDACAVAPVERIMASRRLRRWLADGMHADMLWMERNVERRCDPGRVVPGARSVVMLAMSYWTGDPIVESEEHARISRYAWGREYHEVLGSRVERLWEALRDRVPGIEGRWYVDTGPVLEKAWAERAGLGWIGKHTNLISPEIGSWFFLAALVVDLELPTGATHPDRCGTCRACIDVCPTDAIVAPYVLDSRRCIAYLTIENRGPIPRRFRRAIGNHVFGCDDCQDVCPWNRFAEASAAARAFEPRAGVHGPALRELVSLDRDQFRARFHGTPVLRARRDGFVRNVAVALGNSGDRAAVPPLVDALQDGAALVRGHAAWALGELGGESALAALRSRRRIEDDPWVLEELDAALAALSGRG